MSSCLVIRRNVFYIPKEGTGFSFERSRWTAVWSSCRQIPLTAATTSRPSRQLFGEYSSTRPGRSAASLRSPASLSVRPPRPVVAFAGVRLTHALARPRRVKDVTSTRLAASGRCHFLWQSGPACLSSQHLWSQMLRSSDRRLDAQRIQVENYNPFCTVGNEMNASIATLAETAGDRTTTQPPRSACDSAQRRVR
jgi:hypothetical protein